jgi:hypothetical protein
MHVNGAELALTEDVNNCRDQHIKLLCSGLQTQLTYIWYRERGKIKVLNAREKKNTHPKNPHFF